MSKGSVKIMLSYDYNHFEICLSSDEEMKLDEVNEMAKDAHRLADKAVKRYKTQKEIEMIKYNKTQERKPLENEVKIIKENFPQSEWTPEQKAKVKVLNDINYLLYGLEQYNYEDDWDDLEQL